MKIYNAEDQILGRMSTRIAKDLVKGREVHVVNCEKARISGNPVAIKNKYLERLQRGDPRHGPHYPKTPHGIVRRAIKGMLPTNISKGQKAFKRLKVHTGVPERFKNQEMIIVEEAKAQKLRCKSVDIEELSLSFGVKKRW